MEDDFFEDFIEVQEIVNGDPTGTINFETWEDLRDYCDKMILKKIGNNGERNKLQEEISYADFLKDFFGIVE